MSIFNKDGMIIYPNPDELFPKIKENVLVVNRCYCPKGHNLIDDSSYFNEHHGIKLRVIKKNGDSGIVFLSPFYRDHRRVSFDIELKDNELLKLLCPVCEEEIPVHSKCVCGGDVHLLYLTKQLNGNDFVGVCNRVNCFNSVVKSGGKILEELMNRNL